MYNPNVWLALSVASFATILTRLSGAALAASPLLRRVNEETLSRLFPLVILFCLVFKEVAGAFNSLQLSEGLVSLFSVMFVVAIHSWRRSLFISIIGGTVFHGLLAILLQAHGAK